MQSAAYLAEQWVRSRVRTRQIMPLTGRNQRSHLHYFVHAIGPERELRVDRTTIRRWLEGIAHLSATSRRGHVSTVRMFLNDMVRDGRIQPNVVDLLPKVRIPRSVPRALNRDQVARLLTSLSSDRARVICGLMVWCGLRCAEVSALRVEDIDERGGTILVRGKGGHERVVCIPDEFGAVLSAWLDWRRRIPGPLVLSRWGTGYAPDTVSALVSRWMRTSGVKVATRDGRSAHSLRHTAASDMNDSGVPLTVVQAILGHQHLSSTSIYMRRASIDDMRKAMNGRDYSGA